ncbi:MAG: ABC-F family ATP-binding cassette domain-containing protein [Rhodothermales bacterium]
MIQLSNVSLAFGGQQILHNLTWTIKPNQLIGLIGPNGAGKSTLLRALARRQDIDDGDIAITGGTTIGYLEQNVQEMPTDRSIKEEAMQAFSVVLSLQAEEERITNQLESDMDHEDPAYQRLLGELQSIHDQLQSHEAHRIEDQTEAILTGLGFDADELDRPLVTFSGGWRMRVALAKLLLQRPNFLLLDEPTNHLDIDSIDWLEKYLKAYAGTVVIVSHDRYFLDRMVTTTAELYAGTITEYAGNYSFYLQDRVARRELHKASYDNQQKYIAEAERFITRFRAKASKARQVQSRVKLLDKLERIPPPPDEQASITFRFPVAEQSGRMVLEFSSFSKHYDSDEGRIQVFDKTRPVAIERNDKIALTGKNGAGKSTLARMINGTEEFEGERKVGYKVNLTFFAQHQADALNLKHTILDSMRVVSQGQSETELRSVLGAFLFTGDDVFKPIGVLSGGEKSRVALARTLLVPANFLILDEPTNHLDMQSINVLIEALQQYNGTFVVVSHDRHFLDQIVNKVWRVEDGGVQEYIGNYADYQWQIEHGTASKRQKSADAVSATKSTNGQAAQGEKKRAGGPKTKEQKRKEAEERNQRYKNAVAKSDIDQSITSPAQLKKAYSSLEFTIETKEAALKSVEADLANPDVYNDQEKANQLSTSYQMLKEELAAMYSEWEKMGEILTEM